MQNKMPSIQQVARKLTMYTDPHSIAAEQYRTIRTNIKFMKTETGLKTVLFTSAAKEEGKSTTISNMAIAFAEEGKKVLLIDADMRRPTVHYTFRTSGRVGLSSIFMGTATLEEAIHDTQVPGLYILPCGPIPSNPAEILGSEKMDELIEACKKEYDLVLFDSPPVLSVTDTRILANKCDGTVLIVRAGSSEKENAGKARDVLHTAKGNVLGAVLNNYKLKRNYLRQSYLEY